MPINQSDIEKVAQLAHLELGEEELKTFGPQITEIVNYVEQLNELDTTNVEPALGGLTPEGEKTDSSRNDEILGSLGQKIALEEAPDPASGHFRVPKSALEGLQDFTEFFIINERLDYSLMGVSVTTINGRLPLIRKHLEKSC